MLVRLRDLSKFADVRSSPLTKSKVSSTAFTLIELLVVIAIIAILAALSFPAYRKFVESGYQATSISHLKQLATGAASYAADNNGLFPGFVALNANGSPNYNKGWRYNTDFTQYVGLTNDLTTVPRSSVLFSGFPVKPGNSIGYNNTDMGAATSWAPSGSEVLQRKALRTTTITKPTRLILFAESTSQWINESTREKWTPEVDAGTAGGQFVAYRAAGNTKTIAVTYGGNILMFSKEESADPQLWHAYNQSRQLW